MLKKTNIIMAISALSLLSATVIAGDYSEAQVNLKGEIVSAACGLSIDNMDQTLQLGQYPAHLITSMGNRAALDKPELFDGTECIGVRTLHGGKPIDNGTTTDSVSPVNGTNIVYFSAAYESTSETVKAGSAESRALLRVEYL